MKMWGDLFNWSRTKDVSWELVKGFPCKCCEGKRRLDTTTREREHLQGRESNCTGQGRDASHKNAKCKNMGTPELLNWNHSVNGTVFAGTNEKDARR